MSYSVAPAGETFKVQAYHEAVATRLVEIDRLSVPAERRRAASQAPLSRRASLLVWTLFSLLGWTLALVPAWLLIR